MKIGIIGCGYIGEKRAIAALNNTIGIVSVYDIDASRANKLATKVNAAAAADANAVIAADVDAVFICAVHSELAALSLKALAAGKHVFVEKPAGINLDEIIRVRDLAKEKGRTVVVGFNYRFHPSIMKAMDIISAGGIGELMFLRARHGHGGRAGYEKEWRCDEKISGGGELVDQGSHLIDLSRLFLGDLSLEFAKTPTYYWDTGVEDNAFICLSDASGKLAWLNASWTEWKNMFSLEIYGRLGKIMIEGFGGSYGVEKLTFFRMLPEMGPPETVSWEFPGADRSWDLELLDFQNTLNGKPGKGATIEDVLSVWQIIENIKSKKNL